LAWILAFSVGSIGKVYNQIKNFEMWFRKSIAILFITVGFYYFVRLFL